MPTTLPDAQRITGSILVGGKSMDTLQALTDTYGARLTGSSSYTHAAEWAADNFRAFGIKDVHLEPFSMPNGWERGPASARMIAPSEHALHVASYGWFPPTPAGGVRAQMVLIHDLAPDAIKAQASNLKGKIVLLNSKEVFSERSNKVEDMFETSFRRFAEAGAAAVLVTAMLPNNVLGTGDPLWYGTIAPLPAGSVGMEDGATLMRWLEKGPVTLELDFQNRVSGPFQANNVVAEIRGSEKPDEWVILGAHLDSWDFATGAQDNGAGVAQVLEAARAIAALGTPPKRSIRFALWGGEEEGLVGSYSYVHAHKSELAKCDAALNTDNGAGHPQGWKVENRKDVADAMAPLSKFLLTPLGGGEVSEAIDADTDHIFFALEGVPALDLLVDMSKYSEAHHKQADTLDKVDPHSLADGAAIVAVTAWAIANADQPLARHLDHAAVGQMLKKDDLDQYLKGLGLWK